MQAMQEQFREIYDLLELTLALQVVAEQIDLLDRLVHRKLIQNTSITLY